MKPLFIYNPDAIPKNISFPQIPSSIAIENLELIEDRISFFPCGMLFFIRQVNEIFFNLLNRSFCKDKRNSHLVNQYGVLSLFHKIKLLAEKENAKVIFVISPSISDFYFDSGAALNDLKAKKIRQAKYDGIMTARGYLHIFQAMLKVHSLPHHDHFMYLKSQNLEVNKIFIDRAHYSSMGNELLGKVVFDLLDLEDT